MDLPHTLSLFLYYKSVVVISAKVIGYMDGWTGRRRIRIMR
jgi:hypothetical protein